MLAQPVADYLLAHRSRHLQELMELLQIPSMANLSDNACARAATWLAERLRQCGFEAQVEISRGKPYVIGHLHVSASKPTVLLYGHYDVQSPDPLDQWVSPPFEPTLRDGNLYARGASDDKGQLFAHLMAIEAWQKAGGGSPVNINVLIEGEEEIGSPNLEAFVSQNARELSADAAVISDSEFFDAGTPSLTCALRGLAYFEITFHGPGADIHSGQHGGAVTNPINALAGLVAAMHDETGKVTIPGFYDGVCLPTDAQREAWAQLPFDPAAYAASLGVKELAGGERDFSPLERRWARPTLDCNGIVGGYTGPGSKTIIPAKASTKISTRLVAGQEPEKIIAAFRQFVADRTPPGIRSEVAVYASGRAVALNADCPAMTAASAAVEEAFGEKPIPVCCGASIPVAEMFQRLLKLDVVLLDLGLPDDNLHSPNEKFTLEQLWRGSAAAAAFFQNFGNR